MSSPSQCSELYYSTGGEAARVFETNRLVSSGQRWVPGRGEFRAEVSSGQRWVQGRGEFRAEVSSGQRWVPGTGECWQHLRTEGLHHDMCPVSSQQGHRLLAAVWASCPTIETSQVEANNSDILQATVIASFPLEVLVQISFTQFSVNPPTNSLRTRPLMNASFTVSSCQSS
jgi:hypothetical protein